MLQFTQPLLPVQKIALNALKVMYLSMYTLFRMVSFQNNYFSDYRGKSFSLFWMDNLLNFNIYKNALNCIIYYMNFKNVPINWNEWKVKRFIRMLERSCNPAGKGDSCMTATHNLQWWNLEVISCLKKNQKIYTSRDTSLA